MLLCHMFASQVDTNCWCHKMTDLVGDVDICWKVVEFSFPKDREHVKAKFISVARFIPRAAQVFFTKVK